MTSTMLTFPAGSSDGDMSQCVDVTITEDTLVEGDEAFAVTLTLQTTGVGVTTGNSTTTVTITDNEGRTEQLPTRAVGSPC